MSYIYLRIQRTLMLILYILVLTCLLLIGLLSIYSFHISNHGLGKTTLVAREFLFHFYDLVAYEVDQGQVGGL
jgi:TRAP-type C4-dicarboxylate transport system permease small subunit